MAHSISRAADYRHHAKEARTYAEHLRSAPEQAMWLRIAEEWERMADKAEGKPTGQFAEQPGVVAPPKDKGEG